MEEEEDDVVVRELDVYLASDTAGAQLGLLSCPLRPPWRKYPYEDVDKVRMKPQARRLEMDVPLDTSSANYAGDEAHHARGVEKVTLRSSPVESKTSMAIGILQDGALVLAPLEYCLQLRPHLQYLNSTKKGKEGEEGGEEGGGGEEEEEGEEPTLRAVEVQVQKRETERQLQARINSFAYISQKEEEEGWKELRVHLQESDVACRLWDKLMAPSTDPHATKNAKEREYLSRLEYLHTFVPAIGGTAVGSEAASGSKTQGGGSSSQPQADQAGSAEGVSDAARAAFPNAMKTLFSQHSVCSMANVRQWLQDPKGAGSSAAREAATLTDQALNSMVLDMSGLPLACIRRMYVLKTCGKPEQDGLRNIVVELLQDKESLKRQDILTAASQQNLPITDALYNKVVKDLCVSRNQAWMLKFGADMP